MVKVAFVHPDLGIGGAERLMVDAANALQSRGHSVTVYTSHYSPKHCFAETKNLNIVVRGDFIPRHIFGYFHLLFACLRCFYLAAWIYLVCPHNYDVLIVDQISFSIPILRRCSERTLFYCHFPDKYLAPQAKTASWLGYWRRVYRWFFDNAEERTIGMAHKVLVNSHFTGGKFKQAFPSLKMKAEVLYPAINPSSYDRPWDPNSPVIKLFTGATKTNIFSLNRFERKKNIELAIQAFLWLRDHMDSEKISDLRLVLAGGYDPRVKENIEYLKELQTTCQKGGLTFRTVFPNTVIDFDLQDASVVFLPSISESVRNYLMYNSLCLIYTPSHEHFGIVPVEAMYCGLPVVAVNNGGPRETVINNITGFLCPSQGPSFGMAIMRLLDRTDVDPKRMAIEAKKHARKEFTMVTFADKLEQILNSLFE